MNSPAQFNGAATSVEHSVREDLIAEAPDWVFGYGSIMNNLSRASTGGTAARAVLGYLRPSFGMVRSWNFRSATGFTAVGLRARAESEPLTRMCGVMFTASGSMDAFDLRERGYERVRIPHSSLELADPDGNARNLDEQRRLVQQFRSLGVGRAEEEACDSDDRLPRIWIYVPLSSSCRAASEDFPICQTYVDTVLQGCLAWGGLALAREWVTTTFDWSTFYLNDAPLSRRPWLHRERHAEIDEILMQHADWARFMERRHPEEFAAHWTSGALRGMWGVPPRNHDFVGRERELQRIRSALQSAAKKGEGAAGVTTIETVGLGGVGKTQTAIEYCYRHYQAACDECGYGLIVWVNAESPDTIAAGFRDLAADSGIIVRDMHNEEIVEEIRSRLYRTGCPWLMVFDNVESMEILEPYMPRGGFVAGHVLVTSRRTFPGVPPDRRVSLDCFSTEESVDFLRRKVGDHALEQVRSSPKPGTADTLVVVGHLLADALGHLPLALAMAAGYIAHCDVTCAEYYDSLRSSESGAVLGVGDHTQKLSDYPMGVRESLLLSLKRMNEEEKCDSTGRIQAWSVLNCLAFLAPDGITRPIVRLLVQRLQEEAIAPVANTWSLRFIWQSGSSRPKLSEALLASFCSLLSLLLYKRRKRRLWLACTFAVPSFLVVVSLFKAYRRHDGSRTEFSAVDSVRRVPSKNSMDICQSKSVDQSGHRAHPQPPQTTAEVDRIWMILKEFSLLTVRDRMGSMHRLLQQLLRALQSKQQRIRSTICCIWALRVLWTFDPADTTTWAAAGKLLEHVKVVGRHVDEDLCEVLGKPATRMSSRGGVPREQTPQQEPFLPVSVVRTAAGLLTQGALYMSMALSRFDEADVALEMACRLQRAHLKRGGGLFTRLPTASWSAGADASLCRTLHTRGRVARYRGRLDDASVYLGEALAESRRLAREDEAHKWDVAASLHELGVLKLKETRAEQAEELLRESLAMKRDLQARRVAPLHGTTQLRFTDEAATLHQLAVAAMSSRPCRLDDAEILLQEALTLETSGNPFGRGARAASLQQLARVEIRRGHLDAAQGHLQDALGLYKEAYGQDTPHVNVAAVKTQLGKVACSLALKARGTEADVLFGEAADHFLDALRTQQQIYGSAAGDHSEIASTLGQLGMLERARKALPSAQRYITRQKEMIIRLFAATTGLKFDEGKPFVQPAALDSRGEKLLRQLLGALHWERTLSKDLGSRDRARALLDCIKDVSRALDDKKDGSVCAAAPPCSDSQDSCPKVLVQSSELCTACVAARDTVRKATITAKKEGAVVPQQTLLQVADSLDSVLAQTAADAREFSNLSLLHSAASDFSRAMRVPAADTFVACDALREVLRQVGVQGVN